MPNFFALFIEPLAHGLNHVISIDQDEYLVHLKSLSKPLIDHYLSLSSLFSKEVPLVE